MGALRAGPRASRPSTASALRQFDDRIHLDRDVERQGAGADGEAEGAKDAKPEKGEKREKK